MFLRVVCLVRNIGDGGEGGGDVVTDLRKER